ncbi:Lipoprotein NlpD/LppB homolog [Rubrivivax sp. A210]|uniref:peptidoglycan DD-metalloendopeptidase family protein n=1 Tax=Rubrivivax sp. A210 TaxID=2772301 RepID=UPI0019B78D53|nr:peptidoglycan DD-metalloendopeptidase family protein [Rubrivivax sp. A210]CAD5373931.1 Lipoprotein NlpD/LppB homolog [Rubrivivax sp. A210]
MTPKASTFSTSRMRLATALAALALALLAACASPAHRAPVEDRKASGKPAPSTPAVATAPAPSTPAAAATAASAPGAEPAKPLPGAENVGKPGYYSVRPGDTLIRIGLDFGQPWRDIARWNNLENANLIEVGQVLRVVPPTADSNGVVTRPVAGVGAVDSRPLEGRPAAAPASAAATPAPAPAAPAASGAKPAPAAREGDDDVAWAWPASGVVAAPFEEGKTKGLVIAGKAGDAVLAAADGRVVYAGSGLRGYGNLVIIKHNATFLSAYAHNQALLVKEDQAVRRGQKIAEMGASDAEKVQLHFEVRRMGKPVDPARLLPAR